MSAAWNARVQAQREHERKVIALLAAPKPEPYGSVGWLDLGEAERQRRWTLAEAQVAHTERDSAPHREGDRDGSNMPHFGRTGPQP